MQAKSSYHFNVWSGIPDNEIPKAQLDSYFGPLPGIFVCNTDGNNVRQIWRKDKIKSTTNDRAPKKYKQRN